MSSILEALKKLEAEKNSSVPFEPIGADAPDYGSGTLLDTITEPASDTRSIAPLLWVLGGGMFTLMVVGVAVLLLMLLVNRGPSPEVRVATAPAPVSVEEDVAPTPVEMVTQAVTIPELTDIAETPSDPPSPSETPAPTPVLNEAPPKPTPAPPVVISEPVAESQPVVRTVSTGVGESEISSSPNLAPLPEDIRSLPMLSRAERSQFRLDGVQLNMLNAAGPTRPLGNAFINLEKVFVGEFLPGTNAKLIEVTSHGIAVEIQSTRQRYYIPR